MFTLPPKSKPQIVAEQVEQINNIGQSAVTQIINMHRITFDLFWHNDQATPQEICDALGTQATRLYLNSKVTQEYIKTIYPDYVPLEMPEGVQVVFNEDGTVTIKEVL